MLVVLLFLIVFAGVISIAQLGSVEKQKHNIRRAVSQVTIAKPEFPVSEAVQIVEPGLKAIVKHKPVKPALRIPHEKTQTVQPVKPDIHDIDVAVFVLSRRSAFETREVIRQTWAFGHKNVFFAVGKCCSVPPDDRKKYTCARLKSSSASSQTSWDAQCAAQDKKLANEQQRYSDIITMPEVDVYRHLSQKVKYCYKWGLKHTEAKWFVKTDDDSVVRIGTLGAYLEKTYNSNSPVVIGRISKGWGVPRSGKWAERDYKPSKYPNFPLGSVGHVVSKPVASYIADNSDKLFNYQGEDVSIGIWLHESPLKVKWVTSKRMTNHGNCKDTGMWVIGHNIKPEKMRQCFAHRDEIVAPKKLKIQNISPFSLDLANRFDIIVKAVYAAEWLESGKVSDFTTNMYKKHLQVWNNFKEPCTFTGQKDWFDASKPCVKKTSAQDFLKSFQKTIQSLKENGFDTSKSIVPVTSDLFPLNGAHRIAAAIALRMNTMPVQITSSSHSFNWDANFFIKKGFDKKYADFASANFAMHSHAVESDLSFLKQQKQNLHAVVLFPSVKNQKVDTVKTILSKDAQIITERIFWLNKDAADMFVQQIYPNEAWVSNGAWGKTNYCFPKGTGKFPIQVFFISTSLSLKKVLDTKKNIRELYNIGKHSIHITDTRSQAMDVAKLVLNKHSLRYINHTKWTSPLQRKKIKCTKPKNVDENSRFYIDGKACELDRACGGVPRIFTKSKTHWSSVEELWFALDTANIKYALLRNFENGVIHPKDAHPDVDILLESLEPACCVMTMYGGPEAKCKRNVQNQGQHVTIGGQKVKLDIRILGDKYYDNKWTKDMLEKRVRGHVPNSIAWSISPEDYLFSLIYHVLVHKNKIPSDYPARICTKAKRLGHAMRINQCSDRKFLENAVSDWTTQRGYRFIKPLDRNVPYNAPNTALEKPQRRLRNKVYVCGYKKMATYIAENVFPDFYQAGLVHRDTVSTKNDIMVIGMFGGCAKKVANLFKGKRLYVNGEPLDNVKVPRDSYVIGHSADSANSLRVYFVAIVANRFKNFQDVLSPRIPRVPPKSVLYIALKCYPNREEAFRLLHTIMPVYAGGNCHGQLQENEYTRVTIPPRSSGWETAVKYYSDYRFGLVLDSTKKSGFISEKILVAFMGGTVPIYFGTTEVFDIFNKDAFIYYDVKNPQPALDRIAYLEENQTAYLEVISQPILLHGAQTLERYFSFSDREVGNGKLKKRILDMMGIVPDKHTNVKVPKIHRGSGNYNLDKPTGKKEGTYSWSQFDQDSVVDNILKQKRDGFFVEIGGYDGERHSNTLFFELQRGWDGLLVEANPFTFKQMLSRHRTCGQVHSCISNTLKSMDFKIAGGITSSVQTISQTHSNRIKKAMEVYGKKKQWEGAGNVVTTHCYALSSILDTMGVSHVDYFSLDVEGAEVHILNSIDFKKISFGVISIEVQVNREQIYKIMIKNGYKRVKSLHIDDFYIPTT